MALTKLIIINRNLVKVYLLVLRLEFSFEHGKLVYFGKIFITGGFLSCHGDSLLTEEYPRLNFDCNLDINNKQKFLKKFFIKRKT